MRRLVVSPGLMAAVAAMVDEGRTVLVVGGSPPEPTPDVGGIAGDLERRATHGGCSFVEAIPRIEAWEKAQHARLAAAPPGNRHERRKASALARRRPPRCR